MIKNDELFNNLNICIKDNGEFYDLKEIINELKKYYNNFDTFSMSDYSIFLKGQEDMLGKIINYLCKIANIEI